MRRLLIVFAVVAFCSAPIWADSIELDVNAWATFTATQHCSSNCTETIGMNFLYMPPSDFAADPNSEASFTGQIVPGSMNVSSSGFLGSFSTFSTISISSQGYIPIADSMGDDVDLNVPVGTPDGIEPGINTVSFQLFYCESQACQTAFGTQELHPGPSNGSSVVTRVAVPDGTPFLPLCLSSFGAFGLVWRWRRREVRAPRHT
jgi:hypothetical protein